MNALASGRLGEPGRTGAAATELAIALPFLALMFAAAIDFARVFQVTQTLDVCASAGLQYASGTARTTAATGPAQAAVDAACAAGTSLDAPLQPENVAVTIDNATATATVTITYDFPLLTWILQPVSTIHLTRSATATLAPTPGN